MKQFKRRLAAFLAVLLIVPTLPVRAEEVPQEKVQTEEAVVEDAAVQETVGLEAVEETAVEAPAGQVQTENATVEEAAGQENSENSENAEQVWFNTGNLEISVIAESVSDNEAYQEQWTDFFAADGSYTINIPEANPYFPYEVQFTCNGEVRNEWFMNPQDSVEVGGHTFYVSAYFDDTAVTQMSLKVGGQEVIVYPEEKEFTNDGDGAAEMSLLPLQQRNLTVDLTGFTPVELTMVSIDSIFTGSEALTDTSKVAWKPYGEAAYDIRQTGDKLNLIKDCSAWSNSSALWYIYVGSADQLDMTDIKYTITVRYSGWRNWLKPIVYAQDTAGTRVQQKNEHSTSDSTSDSTSVRIYFEDTNKSDKKYCSLTVNKTIFSKVHFKAIKAFAGKYSSEKEIADAQDITDKIFVEDMSQLDAGFALEDANGTDITFVTYDEAGNVTGCLPFHMTYRALEVSGNTGSGSTGGSGSTSTTKGFIDSSKVWQLDVDQRFKTVCTVESSYSSDADKYEIQVLYAGYAADDLYNISFEYHQNSNVKNATVTAAYPGLYSSISEAEAAGAKDIKTELFDGSKGYRTNFSEGVYFTVFVEEDGAQVIYTYLVKTEEGTELSHALDKDDYAVSFSGFNQSDGTNIWTNSKVMENDSNGENNYYMLIAPKGTDLKHIAPCFNVIAGARLYTAGSSTPEESGKSYHDFSNGALQYTAAMLNGIESKNYWLKIVTAEENAGRLYISSLEDANAHTRVENGITYSDREVLLDGYHSNYHDIFVANIGTEKIANIKAELISDVVQLDKYYTFNGNFDLSGFEDSWDEWGSLTEEPKNIGKIRIIKKDGVEDGTDVTGTLTVKSGDTVLMVLNLTGTIGNPSIVTKEIPAAVKFVPYGTVIQNSNKYSENQVTYELWSGELPAGVEFKKNGELYGVPQEVGEYTFTVRTSNSFYGFQNEHDSATYTLMVEENTDENVEKATDTGYELKERVTNVSTGMSDSRLMVSEGVYSEFQDVYLDGRKLSEGTDYTSESGSTRITLLANTLTNVDTSLQSHTLAIEFRTKDTDTLKRAAQNYTIGSNDSNDDSEDDAGNSTGNAGATSVIGAAKASSGTTETITYTVMPGDTLGKIAAKYFGNANMWRKIYADNGDVIKNPDKIRVGQKLRIILEVQAAGKEETSNAGSVSNANYVVQAGDNLWKIAKKAYGQGYYWKKVYEANQKVISNPGSIRVGQNLYIPAL